MKSCELTLRYLGACSFRKKLWFFNGECNGLFSLGLEDFSVEFKNRIPYLEEKAPGAYYGNLHCCYGSRIYFFPLNYNQIMVYDVERELIQGIPIIPVDGTDSYMTAGIVQSNEKVWIIPSKISQGIFILDLENLQVKADMRFDKAFDGVEYIYNFGNVVNISNTEIAILSGNDTIIGIDVQRKERLYTKCFDQSFRIWGIRYGEGSFWLLPYQGADIYEWNKKEDRIAKYQTSSQEWISGEGVPYANAAFVNGEIFLLPCALKYLAKIDKKTYTLKKAAEYPKGFRFADRLGAWPAFSAFDVIDNHKLLLHPLRGNRLLLYDTKKDSMEGKRLAVSAEEVPYLDEVIMQGVLDENGIAHEMDEVGSGVLGLLIAQSQVNSSRKETKTGKRIYEAILGK